MSATPCSSTQMYGLITTADMEIAAAAAFPCKNNNHQQWTGGLFFTSKPTLGTTDYGGPGPPDPTNEAVMAAWMNNIHQHDHDPSLRNQGPSSLSLRSSDQSSSIITGLPAASDQLGQHRQQNPGYSGQSWIRASQYLSPAQDLLKELCDISRKETDELELRKGGAAASHRLEPSLDSLDLLGLKMRKTKLIQMIHEVDQRYNHYYNQMRSLVSSFEFAAGDGAATVYSVTTSKVMSKHFRCLRDEIAAQIKATRKAIEVKNTNNAVAETAASAKGETPRLRLLDQALRQHRHMNIMGSHPWRAQRGLPERSVSLLRAWLFEHFFYPYPSDVEKHILAHQTGLSRSQVSNWFINARVRLWKPMVEEMYSAELKDGLDETEQHQSHLSRPDDCDRNPPGLDPTAISRTSRDAGNPQKSKFVEMDFPAYDDRSSGGDGGGVSLSLGLQALPPAAAYQMVSYSVLDEVEGGQNLVYRDLMEAQLLHDLAG